MDLMIDQKQTKRCVVLITNCLANHNELAHAVYWMAEREHLSVLYLVLVDNPENMLAASRNMATVKAVTSANRLWVDVKLTPAGDWPETLRKLTSPDDVIICQDDQMVVDGSLQAIPVSEFLSSHLDSTVHSISTSNPFQPQSKSLLHGIFTVFGFLVILTFFAWLQFELDSAFDGALQKIFLLGSFFIEMGSAWLWSILTFR